MTLSEDGELVIDHAAQTAINDLKLELKSKLDNSVTISRHIKWKEGGISEKHGDHKRYLEGLCEQIVTGFGRMIEESLSQEKEDLEKQCTHFVQLNTPLKHESRPNKMQKVGGTPAQSSHLDFALGYNALQSVIESHQQIEESVLEKVIDHTRVELNKEIRHHLQFCKAKCEIFCGRSEELLKVEEFLKQTGSTKPLVVHAKSGGGKTAFMAMVTKSIKTWLGRSSVTVVRFLGTSPQSSTLQSLLLSLCNHVSAAYSVALNKNKLRKLSQLIKYFQSILYTVSTFAINRPLVILLDSLDQLSSDRNTHSLTWLPTLLPPHVYLLVSVLPDVTDCFKNLKDNLNENVTYLALPKLETNIVYAYIDKHLENKCRSLTENQWNHVSVSATENPSPLYMKMLMDISCKWRSYEDVTGISLPLSIEDSIHSIFQTVEKKFGSSFLRACLGYLTIGDGGLSEVELEDILSMQDAVLNDVYKFHDPPVAGIIRIPPLLWSRLRCDLNDYLVERRVHGRTIIAWYHRQFWEAAISAYCSDKETKKSLHSDLADLYLVGDGFKRSITLKYRKDLKIDNADRQITPQIFSHKNKRLLTSLPLHLCSAERFDDLKLSCYCNLNFIQSFIEAFSMSELLNHLEKHVTQYNDKEVLAVHNSLLFADFQINRDMSTLPVQLLGQLIKYNGIYPSITNLCKTIQCDILECDGPVLMPVAGSTSSSSDGLLWYLNEVNSVLANSSDCTHFFLEFLCGRDQKIKYKILALGSQYMSRDIYMPKGCVPQITHSIFSNDNKQLFVLCKENVFVYATKTAALLQLESTNINNSGAMHSCLAISPTENYLVIAGTHRLAMLEDKTVSETESQYRAKSAMSLSGATATGNIIFCNNDCTVSTHSIKGQKKTIGAIVMWNVFSKQLTTKVGVSKPIVKGFLHQLPLLADHVMVVGGCQDGQIIIVDMEIGQIVQTFGDAVDTRSPYLSHYDIVENILFSGYKGKTTISVWNCDLSKSGLQRVIETDEKISYISGMNSDELNLLVGDVNGNLQVMNVSQDGENMPKIHKGEISFLCCDDKARIISAGSDGALKLWDYEKINSNKNMEENITNSRILHKEVHNFTMFGDTSGDMLFATGKLRPLT